MDIIPDPVGLLTRDRVVLELPSASRPPRAHSLGLE